MEHRPLESLQWFVGLHRHEDRESVARLLKEYSSSPLVDHYLVRVSLEPRGGFAMGSVGPEVACRQLVPTALGREVLSEILQRMCEEALHALDRGARQDDPAATA